MDGNFEHQMAVLRGLIDSYKSGDLKLYKFVLRVEGVSNSIECDDWNEKIYPIILELEQVNAATIMAGNVLNDQQDAIVVKAIENLRSLIASVGD